MRGPRGVCSLLFLAMLMVSCGQQGEDQELAVEEGASDSSSAQTGDALDRQAPDAGKQDEPVNDENDSNEGAAPPAAEPEAKEGKTDDVASSSDESASRESDDSPEEKSESEPKIVDLPYREPGDEGVMPSALLRGTLAADRELDGGCAWIATENGSTVPVLWDELYQLSFPDDGSAAELVDSTGAVVAREGETVELGGGFGEAWSPMERCHVASADDDNRAWWGWLT